MRFLKNIDPKFHLFERRTGLFLGLALVGFLIILSFVMWRADMFKPVKQISLTSSSSQGIKEGMAVRLSGFRIGWVSKIKLEGGNDVEITLQIYEKHFDLLRVDSTARINSDSLIEPRSTLMKTFSAR